MTIFFSDYGIILPPFLFFCLELYKTFILYSFEMPFFQLNFLVFCILLFFVSDCRARKSHGGYSPAVWEWMNRGVKDMGLYLCFAFSGAKDR